MGLIATFPLAAIRKTRLELKAAGAVPIIAVDPVEERREEALYLGADYALNPLEDDFYRKTYKNTPTSKICENM